MFELTLPGPAEGNPFTDVELSARFIQNNRTTEVEGFYDGEGIYKVRFMPDTIGEWRYETVSNRLGELSNGSRGRRALQSEL